MNSREIIKYLKWYFWINRDVLHDSWSTEVKHRVMNKNKENLGNLKYWNTLPFPSGLWEELSLKSVLQYCIFRFASALHFRILISFTLPTKALSIWASLQFSLLSVRLNSWKTNEHNNLLVDTCLSDWQEMCFYYLYYYSLYMYFPIMLSYFSAYNQIWLSKKLAWIRHHRTVKSDSTV